MHAVPPQSTPPDGLGPQLAQVYRQLLAEYGPQGWWPTTPRGGTIPRYRPGVPHRPTARQQWEIAVGAVLTQNTAWRNVEQALHNLATEGLRDASAVHAVPRPALAALVRPSGYYNQKARRLHVLAAHVVGAHRGRIPAWLSGPTHLLRCELLALWGIGPETADSILLYAAERPVFVVDAYTRRIFGRMGLISARLGYDAMQSLFTAGLPADAQLFGEYHALLVKHAASRCRSAPSCTGCALGDRCEHGRSHHTLHGEDNT